MFLCIICRKTSILHINYTEHNEAIEQSIDVKPHLRQNVLKEDAVNNSLHLGMGGIEKRLWRKAKDAKLSSDSYQIHNRSTDKTCSIPDWLKGEKRWDTQQWFYCKTRGLCSWQYWQHQRHDQRTNWKWRLLSWKWTFLFSSPLALGCSLGNGIPGILQNYRNFHKGTYLIL